jgi:hypothetical protein
MSTGGGEWWPYAEVIISTSQPAYRCLGGHRAVGYRSPGADLSPNSTRLLAEYGFVYESSMSAQDFEPYWCRTGDVVDVQFTTANAAAADWISRNAFVSPARL